MSDAATDIKPIEYVSPEARAGLDRVRAGLDSGDEGRRIACSVGAAGVLAREVLRLAGRCSAEAAELIRLRRALHDARDVVAGLSNQLQLAIAEARPLPAPDAALRVLKQAQDWSAAASPAAPREITAG